MRFTQPLTDLYKNVRKEAEATGAIPKPKPKPKPKTQRNVAEFELDGEKFVIEWDGVGDDADVSRVVQGVKDSIGVGEYSDRFLPAAGGAKPTKGIDMVAPKAQPKAQPKSWVQNATETVGKKLTDSGVIAPPPTGQRATEGRRDDKEVYDFASIKLARDRANYEAKHGKTAKSDLQKFVFDVPGLGKRTVYVPFWQVPELNAFASRAIPSGREQDQRRLASAVQTGNEWIDNLKEAATDNPIVNSFGAIEATIPGVKQVIGDKGVTGHLAGMLGGLLGVPVEVATEIAVLTNPGVTPDQATRATLNILMQGGAADLLVEKAVKAGLSRGARAAIEAGSQITPPVTKPGTKAALPRQGPPTQAVQPSQMPGFTGLPKPKPTSVLDEVLGPEPLKTSPAETVSTGSVLDEVLDAPANAPVRPAEATLPTGKGVVAFHGTNAEFDGFDPTMINSRESLGDYVGEGFFFHKDQATAARYGKNVKQAELRLENPLIINTERDAQAWRDSFGGDEKFFDLSPSEIQAEAKRRGYDGLADNLYGQYAVFDADQIKTLPTAATPEPTALDEVLKAIENEARAKTQVAEQFDLMGSDGKWHNANGFPFGVTWTGEKRPYWAWTEGGRTYKRFNSEAEATDALDKIIQGKVDEMRDAVNEDPSMFADQYKFFTGKDYAPTGAKPLAKPANSPDGFVSEKDLTDWPAEARLPSVGLMVRRDLKVGDDATLVVSRDPSTGKATRVSVRIADVGVYDGEAAVLVAKPDGSTEIVKRYNFDDLRRADYDTPETINGGEVTATSGRLADGQSRTEQTGVTSPTAGPAITGPTAQTVTPDATTPTSARQADINADREALGKAGFSTDDVRKWSELEAKADPDAVPMDGDEYKVSAWSDQETVNATAKLRDLKAKIEALRKSKADPETLVTLEDKFDKLTEAMYRSGTEQGRALAARRYTMDVDMSADGLRARYKARAAKNGTKVDTKRLAELEQIAKDYKALKEQIDRKSPLDIDALAPNDPRLDPMHYDGLTDSSLYDPELVNRAYVELFGDLPDDLPLDARAKAVREGLQDRINRAIEEDVREANVGLMREALAWFKRPRGKMDKSATGPGHGWNVAVPGRLKGDWVAGQPVRMISTEEIPPEFLQMFLEWFPGRSGGAERYIKGAGKREFGDSSMFGADASSAADRGLGGRVAQIDELLDYDGSHGLIPQSVADEFVRDLARQVGEDTGEVVVRRQRRVHLDSEFDDLLSEFKKAALSSANTGIPPELVPIVGKMVANRIKAGAASIEDIVIAIQKKFRERLLDPPERQDIIDAYAEYKATAKPEPNERAQKLREKRSKIEREMREESTQRKSKYVADAEAKAKRAAEAADARAKKAAERQQRIEADRKAKADQKAKARAEREAADAEAKALREEQERILGDRKDWDKRNADKKRELERLNARIAELEQSIEAGTGMGPKSRKPSKDAADVERARARMDMLKRRAKAIYEAQNRQSSPVMDATREVTGALRWTQLGADVGALFRQGLYGLTRPAAWGRSAVKGAKALVSEAEFEVGMSQIFNREIKGNLMEPIRRRAGLQLTDSITDVEEGFISRLLSKVPIIGRPLERGQAMFLNALRADVFDTFYKNLPDATAQELASRAQFINSAFGRSNLKRVNETLQIVMTSPRYTASRWEMAGAALKYGPKAVKDRGARANIQDLAVAAGGIITALKIAEASGAEVEWDPTSTDFGKIRVGKTVYDPTAGVAMPIRTAMRIYTYITTKGSAGYNGNPMDEGFNVLGNTLSPGIRKPIESMMGQSMRGYELDDVEKSAWGWAPLIVQGVVKNWGDWGQMGAQAGAEFVGINSNKYDKPKQTFRDRIDKNVETFNKKNP